MSKLYDDMTNTLMLSLEKQINTLKQIDILEDFDDFKKESNSIMLTVNQLIRMSGGEVLPLPFE